MSQMQLQFVMGFKLKESEGRKQPNLGLEGIVVLKDGVNGGVREATVLYWLLAGSQFAKPWLACVW